MTPSANVAALYTLAALTGVRNTYYWVPSVLDQLLPIAMGVILVGWAIEDARRRGHPFPLTSRSWVFCFAPLAIPSYLIWSRGWRGLAILVGNWLGMMAVATVVMHLGGLLWFGREWIRAIVPAG